MTSTSHPGPAPDLPCLVNEPEILDYPLGSPPVVRYTYEPDTLRRRLRDIPVGAAGKDVLAAVDLLEARDQQPTVARVANVLRRNETYIAAALEDLDTKGYLVWGQAAQVLLKYAPRRPAERTAFPAAAHLLPCALYWHYDADDVLLYIGISRNVVVRSEAHARSSEWVRFAVRAEARWYATRVDASVAEVAAIRRDKPVFNRAHNDSPEADRRRTEYLACH